MITGPNGHRLMLDCGESLHRPWFPSITHRNQRIDTLMLMNLDEDHVADLPGIWDDCAVGALVTNPTISPQALKSMKPDGMWSGVTKAHELLKLHGAGPVGDWMNGLGGISWQVFFNRYGLDFRDTNNLSLACFVTYGPFTILFGGDMEKPGWDKLMENPNFRRRLLDVTVYVASHHGRENGKCAQMFDWMSPEIAIISDCNKKHGTQETTCWYADRVKGIPDYSRPYNALMQAQRKVFTTRKDGSITIMVEPTGKYLVNWEHTAERYENALAAALMGHQPSSGVPLGLLAQIRP